MIQNYLLNKKSLGFFYVKLKSRISNLIIGTYKYLSLNMRW